MLERIDECVCRNFSENMFPDHVRRDVVVMAVTDGFAEYSFRVLTHNFYNHCGYQRRCLPYAKQRDFLRMIVYSVSTQMVDLQEGAIHFRVWNEHDYWNVGDGVFDAMIL